MIFSFVFGERGLGKHHSAFYMNTFISLFFLWGWEGHVRAIKKKKVKWGIYFLWNANSKSETVIENDVLLFWDWSGFFREKMGGQAGGPSARFEEPTSYTSVYHYYDEHESL